MASGCPGKQAWPELVGSSGPAAASTVRMENPNVRPIVLPEGSPTTRDFRCDRVWIFVDGRGTVTQTPTVG